MKLTIECTLYSIPFEVKVIKNIFAFIADCSCMLLGYLIILPRIIKILKIDKEFNKTR